ncbi:MAG: DUF1013 domain-containing protein [Alphaproteobacteria bacterium]|nr:MAG: DUF1013 domain-containing protein [Alphaproteobacteria bacterium]TAE81263.1 MAG: DUF1013 domain-containing protein [Alphaproteobacteria bacterium]TAF15586.1 MAG: DUF1013 domain-containing protein [Alphaproteobacteria bacterium]TAF41990.1 MAG: DUF1013 domain-containing protein [Alphaproteobacteria bacterium]TAF76598.1 MAG: DUF1013 domain-containing protein [Alphaproteobacteria bacterium]
MTLPLMPKATAVWLVENTALTFDQIADFCGMHPLEVQGIADGEVAVGIRGVNPIEAGQITKQVIELAEANPKSKLKVDAQSMKLVKKKAKGGKYTPIARRQDKPEAVAWLLKNHPYISDTKIIKLIGTTKKTIESVRDKSHWNAQNMTPKDPVLLGLCSQHEMDALVKATRPKNDEIVDVATSSYDAHDDGYNDASYES